MYTKTHLKFKRLKTKLKWFMRKHNSKWSSKWL
jgi:hypothetical protein